MNDPNEGIETHLHTSKLYNLIHIEMNDPNEGIETVTKNGVSNFVKTYRNE